MDLEGKELEGPIGDIGKYEVDVDKTGMVKISASVGKDFDGVKASNELSVEVSIFTLLEKLTAKTDTKIDDAIVAKLKALVAVL